MGGTLVRRDVHGPYARFGGYLFRPWASDGPRLGSVDGGKPTWLADGVTSIQEGERVLGRHVGGSVDGRVRRENGDVETWQAHGAYERFVEGKPIAIPSEALWTPSAAPSTTP